MTSSGVESLFISRLDTESKNYFALTVESAANYPKRFMSVKGY